MHTYFSLLEITLADVILAVEYTSTGHVQYILRHMIEETMLVCDSVEFTMNILTMCIAVIGRHISVRTLDAKYNGSSP